MRRPPLQGRTLALLGVILPLLAVFIYVGLRSGPLAPVAVMLVTVQSQALKPALFGIGTVEARYTQKMGPTFAGRIKSLDVQVGDRVKAGQVLGEMEPVDLDDRLKSQDAGYKRAQAVLVEAQARQAFAQTQAQRYAQLWALRTVSEELATTKGQELQIADAVLAAAREELARSGADRAGLASQRSSLRLIAPVDGVVAARDADPGTTVIAGQTVLEILDPQSLWVHVRFDQISAAGLASGLPSRIALRSRGDQVLTGRVLRVEPKADAITEEALAKLVFDTPPQPLPSVGELAEVTVDLPALGATLVVPNATIRKEGGKPGVWQVIKGELRFTPVKLGAADLNGMVQVLAGLQLGDQVVSYSEKTLSAKSRIHQVEGMAGVPE